MSLEIKQIVSFTSKPCQLMGFATKNFCFFIMFVAVKIVFYENEIICIFHLFADCCMATILFYICFILFYFIWFFINTILCLFVCMFVYIYVCMHVFVLIKRERKRVNDQVNFRIQCMKSFLLFPSVFIWNKRILLPLIADIHMYIYNMNLFLGFCCRCYWFGSLFIYV